MNRATPFSDEASRSGVSAERFKRVMRNIASSVAVITTEHQGRKHGMTATAVCSVSTSPPTVLIVVNRSARSHPIISQAGRFTVNILADHQAKLGSRFAEKHICPFDGVAHRGGASSGPVLEDAAAYLECETLTEIDAGSHTIFIGAVMGGDAATSLPLLYHAGEYKVLFGRMNVESAKRENE
jgi:flavin reductase